MTRAPFTALSTSCACLVSAHVTLFLTNSDPARMLVHLIIFSMLVKLPALLAHTDLGQQATGALVACLQDFMKFLVKNMGTYNTVYEDTTGQYKKFVPA